MVFSEAFGLKSFNINVPERNECLKAIYEGKEYDSSNKNESIRNIYSRYKEIEELFPSEIADNCLMNFGDWLQEKVCFIQIVADTEQDAHKVFVSMNDRGLSLTPAEMLKGYILSEIKEDNEREKCNSIWKSKILNLKEIDVKEDETFIKHWLRAKYADTIRETKKNAVPKDFDIIGTEFHKWVRDEKKKIGLNTSQNYIDFINEFAKYVDVYVKIKRAENIFEENLRHVYYNSKLDFTLQYQLLLASINIEDFGDVIDKKIELVSIFIDMYIHVRAVNYKSNNYSAIKNAVFNITKRIRNLSLGVLSEELKNIYNELEFDFNTLDKLEVNLYTKKYIRNMLARITGLVEQESGMKNNYLIYVDRNQAHPFDVEHITPDHYDWYKEEYSSEEEFNSYRNNFADLVLLNNHINQSLNDNKYKDKVKVYVSNNGNILAGSLDEMVYKNNPQFKKFIDNNELLFKPYDNFNKEAINERKILYKQLCSIIWNIENLKY